MQAKGGWFSSFCSEAVRFRGTTISFSVTGSGLGSYSCKDDLMHSCLLLSVPHFSLQHPCWTDPSAHNRDSHCPEQMWIAVRTHTKELAYSGDPVMNGHD